MERVIVKELKLTTAVEKQVGKFNTAEIIPAGTTGRVIDIMLEPENKYHPVMFLLEFESNIEWYTPEELDGCDTAIE